MHRAPATNVAMNAHPPSPSESRPTGRLVLVCGSRSFTNKREMYFRLRTFGPHATVIHGGARGADTLAGEVATELGLTVREFPADWETHGKRAGILRNLAMLDERPDCVLAFWDGESRGTKHTLDEAGRRGIPRWIVPKEFWEAT